MKPARLAILREYVFGGDAPRSGLLFPSLRVEGQGLIWDLRKPLDAIATRAGWKQGKIRLHLLRHCYSAARIQTLDRGAPVSMFAVSRELGHGGERITRDVYAHLGEIRHRSEVVEYEVEHHNDLEAMQPRLQALRSEAENQPGKLAFCD